MDAVLLSSDYKYFLIDFEYFQIEMNAFDVTSKTLKIHIKSAWTKVFVLPVLSLKVTKVIHNTGYRTTNLRI